ncbi:hypothetical protein [Risungbinella massiliensis]|uniref:hypothetical protein n=1 Tax=Risungbinella massiliensis TaxID=1329796 RepID=UPI0005CB8486|nr:hypothetical protein [Risungbinella massiliensis]
MALAAFRFIPLLTGSKTPTSRMGGSKEDGWGTTERKGPIGSTKHQWGIKKTPINGASFYLI